MPWLQLLIALSKKAQLKEKIDGMFGGEHLNVTEDRAALHVALRAPRDEVSLKVFVCVCCAAYGLAGPLGQGEPEAAGVPATVRLHVAPRDE